MPDFDLRNADKIGWLSGRVDILPETRGDSRFCKRTNIFDLLTDKYDAWYDSEEERSLYESEFKCIRPMVESSSKLILEIGVGTGRFAMHFPEVIGIDPSLNAFKMAGKRGIKTV